MSLDHSSIFRTILFDIYSFETFLITLKQMTETVTLYMYDITGGMAKALSMSFLGKQIDAVYHTSVVVYGTEYYFGGGICK